MATQTSLPPPCAMPGSSGELNSKHDDDLPALPCYISSRSADVILSDVRPTKLSIDALNCINALLDELLHTILSASRALSTTQLRAGLHKVLPTTLGKEAVLEAELELRAYWERTGGAPASASSGMAARDSEFNLPWTFELLRLKCEAYSTLSDTDENSDAEARLLQRMNAEGIPPPKQALLAPASLYLTAIIESICEHIVSNVGRVAARDSSRAVANGQDLFIALCEDSAIYGPFKNMAVYGQIEALSKPPRFRRSISATPENDGTPPVVRRNGSIRQSRTRLSSESINNAPPSTTQSSRPSSRAVKMLYNKVSQDFINGSDPGHRKMDSFTSANTKQSLVSKGDRSPISPTFSEDTRSQEFDDMMRSGSTMKVSLTPDRLRTMEALNREKARVNGRHRVSPTIEKSNGVDIHPSLSPSEQAKRNGPTPIVRRVGSVVGDEDDHRLMEKPPPTSRPRQLSAATSSGYTAPSFTRVRASSTATDPSATVPNLLLNKQPLSKSAFNLANPRVASGSIPKRKVPPQQLDLNVSRPPRIRPIVRGRESLNVEDILAGSDDDDMKSCTSPKQHDRQRGFSSSTKELIAFLEEGPPVSGENNLSTLSTTPKKSGRLQRIISRITLASDTVKSSRKIIAGSGDPSSKSMTNLSPLANRPVPPRYPTSAASSERNFADQVGTHPRQRAQSHVQKPLPSWDGKSMEGDASGTSILCLSAEMEEISLRSTTPVPMISRSTLETDVSQHVQPIPIETPSSPTLFSPPATLPTVRVEATDTTSAPAMKPPTLPPVVPLRVASEITPPLRQKVAPAPPSPKPLPAPSVLEHAREMRTMLEHATSAAECRILMDMFLARSKLIAGEVSQQGFPALPPPQESNTNGLEKTIVELLLGDGELDVQHIFSTDSHGVEPVENPLKGAATSFSSASRPAESSEPC